MRCEIAFIPAEADEGNPWTVGMRRVEKISKEEMEKGFGVIQTGVGVDASDLFVYVYDGFRIIRVYEITNYKTRRQYVNIERGIAYREHLLRFKGLELFFVCSYEENMRYLPEGRKFFESAGIRVRVEGFQD